MTVACTVLPVLSSSGFSVSDFTFRSLIHLQLVLSTAINVDLILIFYMWTPVFPALFVERKLN